MKPLGAPVSPLAVMGLFDPPEGGRRSQTAEPRRCAGVPNDWDARPPQWATGIPSTWGWVRDPKYMGLGVWVWRSGPTRLRLGLG